MRKKFNNVKNFEMQINYFFQKNEIEKSVKTLDTKLKNSIDIAFIRIFNFHKNQKFQ